MLYLFLKSLHIIAFTAWFSGIFYLGRIFVYHAESRETIEPKKDFAPFTLMERRALNIICIPAMTVTWICGGTMLVMNGMGWLKENPWMIIKLVLLVFLSIHTLTMKREIITLEYEKMTTSSYKYRLRNEIPTLFLFSIVLLAVFRNGLNMVYALLGIVVLMAILQIATKMYKTIRDKRNS